jgi:uncharacterized protein with NAD-binding domain and iron-sulfur cluster
MDIALQYKNIFRILEEIGATSALTDWQRSSLYSPDGVEVDSPVFQSKPRLPTPLGQFVHTLTAFTRLSVPDRLSLWRLAPALAEYQQEYERYDRLSVAELMRANDVSPRFYRGFLEPLLLATLFAPPEALSAAVTIGAFEFLVLGTQVHRTAAETCLEQLSRDRRFWGPLPTVSSAALCALTARNTRTHERMHGPARMRTHAHARARAHVHIHKRKKA